jgi:hypothetical protein
MLKNKSIKIENQINIFGVKISLELVTTISLINSLSNILNINQHHGFPGPLGPPPLCCLCYHNPFQDIFC